MGFWDKLIEPLEMSWLQGPSKVKEKIINSLEFTSQALEVAESFIDDVDKLSDYRAKIDKTVEILSLPDTIIENYGSAMKIVKAVSDLRGNIRDNPQRAAKAFGKLFSGIGELAEYLPFPINSYLAIFADAEDFFENVRVQRQPEIHFREPGLRDVIDNL